MAHTITAPNNTGYGSASRHNKPTQMARGRQDLVDDMDGDDDDNDDNEVTDHLKRGSTVYAGGSYAPSGYHHGSRSRSPNRYGYGRK